MIDTIIVPQGAEYRAVKQGLNKLKIQQPSIVSIPIGTKQITETLEEQNFWQSPPSQVLMMGLCGSLSSQYAIGDVVLYQNCFNLNREKILIEPKLNRLICQKLNNVSLVSGLTSDRFVATIIEKQQLAQNFVANVVDMESFAYLQFLQQKAIVVSILRVVSDDLKHDLPNLESTIDETGNIKPVAMTKAMLKQPFTSIKFIRNGLQSLQQLQQITTDLFVSY